MILQKSFKYADLLLKIDYDQCWKHLCCFIFDEYSLKEQHLSETIAFPNNAKILSYIDQCIFAESN